MNYSLVDKLFGVQCRSYNQRVVPFMYRGYVIDVFDSDEPDRVWGALRWMSRLGFLEFGPVLAAYAQGRVLTLICRGDVSPAWVSWLERSAIGVEGSTDEMRCRVVLCG
jgi:hypothetical protein